MMLVYGDSVEWSNIWFVFYSGLSMTLEPLRIHTRKNTEFVWSPDWEQSFQEVKQKQTSAPILIYYDPTKELVLQVENSKDGVGAVLMQDGRPLKYALRALTASERKWAQNEMDAMGVQRFDQYTYGHRIVVENYHKPLETILQKPRIQIPERRETSYCRHS